MTVPNFLRGRRGAFSALGGAAVAVMLFVIAPFAATIFAQRDDIANSKRQIEAAQSELAMKPELENQFETLGASAATVPGLLSANTAALAQAQLQSGMKSIIDANGGVLLSAQIMPPIRCAGLMWLPSNTILRCRFRG